MDHEPGIIFTPSQEHTCAPGWERVPVTGGSSWLPPDVTHTMQNTEAFAPEGSVWECACGKTYVAYYERDTGRMTALWRPERRRERKRRLRDSAD